MGQDDRRRLRMSSTRNAPRRSGSSFSSCGQIEGGPSTTASGFPFPISASISSSESDSLRIVSILSAESSRPAPSVNSRLEFGDDLFKIALGDRAQHPRAFHQRLRVHPA